MKEVARLKAEAEAEAIREAKVLNTKSKKSVLETGGTRPILQAVGVRNIAEEII